jgi:hypothetical protein
MTIRTIVFVVLLGAFAIPAQAQQLTQTEIAAAISEGARTKPTDIGLVMTAKPSFKERLALAAIDTFGGGAEFWTGFAMAVYTPASWIQLSSARAAARFETLENATGDMKKPVLRIFLKPNANSRAVIRDTAKTAVLRPLVSRACTGTIQFGNEVSNDCVELHFDLAAVRKLQDAKGEFLINVQVMGQDGDRQVEMQRDFQVKGKHLNDLPGLK